MSLPPRPASGPTAKPEEPVESDPEVELQRKAHAALTSSWMPVVMRPDVYGAPGQQNNAGSDAVHKAAAEGTSGVGTPLPHLDQIQRSFGRHDVGQVQAHTGSRAAESAGAIGAEAFATGDHVAFAGTPSLATAAHEAAHVVQQRSGVQLKGGVGESGDRYEQHADAVAALVVQGKSAEALLDEHAGPAGPATDAPGTATQKSPVQCRISIQPAHFARGLGVAPDALSNAQLLEYLRIAVEDDVRFALHAAQYAKDKDARTQISQLVSIAKTASRAMPERLAAVNELIDFVNNYNAENNATHEDNYTAGGHGAVIPTPNRRTRYATTPDEGYVHTDLNTKAKEAGKWGDDETMWSQFAEGVGPGVDQAGYQTAEPAGKKLIPLQKLPWDEAKRLLPRPLINLIFDVRYQLESEGQVVIDERTPNQQARRDKSPNQPGTLRSWHQDSNGVLPSTGPFDPNNPPAHADALHQHYNQHSQTGAGASIGEGIAGPQGLAEYTGTGSNWEHNTKVVVDYASKRVYLTLTHYQYWALVDKGGAFEFFACETQNLEMAQGKVPEGAILMSPWMEILMPAAG